MRPVSLSMRHSKANFQSLLKFFERPPDHISGMNFVALLLSGRIRNELENSEIIL